MCRDKKCVSICVPSLLDRAIVFDTCVTVCMCMECMYRRSILWDTTFSYMCLCTEWMYSINSSLLIKEPLQVKATRSMAVKILIANTSLVNGMSNANQI